jgi:hypothetical protein
VWRVLARCHDIGNRSEYEGDLYVDERLLEDLIQASELRGTRPEFVAEPLAPGAGQARRLPARRGRPMRRSRQRGARTRPGRAAPMRPPSTTTVPLTIT